MSALGDAIAAWRALFSEERARLTDYLVDDTRERREEVAKLSVNPTRKMKTERAALESWIRVNEAAIALLEAAARAPVGTAPPLERIKEAARRAARKRAA